MITRKHGAYISVITASALLCGAAMAGQAAAEDLDSHFSFKSVEFLPRDQRVPATRAFVRRVAAPGTSMAAAADALRRAGAYCSAVNDAGFRCTHASEQKPFGQDLEDVVWTVKVRGGPGGVVAMADVDRQVAGN